MERPSDPKAYVKWWNREFRGSDTRIGRSARKRYDDVSEQVKAQFEQSAEWKELILRLNECDARYRYQHGGYDLLMKTPEKVRLSVKPWDSFLSKVWRRNVVENPGWDNEPCGGWFTPLNWFERINDILRTTIVVKYLDGVALLLDEMCVLFKRYGCDCEPDWQAREEGYYAAHLDVARSYELLLGSDVVKKRIAVEIQVTTQMKDVIKELTHVYYERKRMGGKAPDVKWQWDYKSEEFAPNYMGHIIHYVEGTIMEIRDRRQDYGRSESQ